MKRIIFIAILTAVIAIPAVLLSDTVVSPKIAKLLDKAAGYMEAKKFKDAVNVLENWDGEDHPLIRLRLGMALEELSRTKDAMEEYQKALDMNKTFWQAGVAMAGIHARKEDWKKAVAILGEYLNTENCDADSLLFYCSTAIESKDPNLAGELVRRGMLRFPSDNRFRRARLVLAVTENDTETAARVATTLLRNDPADTDLWKQLAWSCNNSGKDKKFLAALEAVYLCNVSDFEVHRKFIAALLASGDWITAIEEGKKLLSGPNSRKVSSDPEIMSLLVQAADTGEKDKLLEKWLGMVEMKKRTRLMHIAAAKLSLRRGKTAEARKSVERLIELGAPDASVYLWVGHLSEQDEDYDAAVVYYKQARKLQGGSGSGSLYLARLYYRTGREREAADILRQYLFEHPEDSAARAMLSLME